ncbi:LmbE-like protein [Umbelopsis sp. PMI_123]|nr:LmbE-like protein [Umbelopsis sp. PMI_123]
MLALAISGVILITLFTYIYQLVDRIETGASTVHTPQSPFEHSNILLVTAHPDDECMFFGPVLCNLTSKRLKNQVHVLCLSKGDAENLGNQRKRELVKSCQVLGIPSSRVKIVDHPELPDSMKIEWNASLVSSTLQEYVTKHDIQIIITFDNYGVSGHTNHKAAYRGALHYITNSDNRVVSLYKLPSVSLLRKYIGLGDLPLAVLSGRMVKSSTAKTNLLFVSSPGQYLITHKAMRQHSSQLVWFRWLYVIFSRYMMVNELEKVS